MTDLKRDSFTIKKDAAGKEYATIVYNEATKNHPGDLYSMILRERSECMPSLRVMFAPLQS